MLMHQCKEGALDALRIADRHFFRKKPAENGGFRLVCEPPQHSPDGKGADDQHHDHAIGHESDIGINYGGVARLENVAEEDKHSRSTKVAAKECVNLTSASGGPEEPPDEGFDDPESEGGGNLPFEIPARPNEGENQIAEQYEQRSADDPAAFSQCQSGQRNGHFPQEDERVIGMLCGICQCRRRSRIECREDDGKTEIGLSINGGVEMIAPLAVRYLEEQAHDHHCRCENAMLMELFFE